MPNLESARAGRRVAGSRLEESPPGKDGAGELKLMALPRRVMRRRQGCGARMTQDLRLPVPGRCSVNKWIGRGDGRDQPPVVVVA
jgi:hypothetical protein